MVVAPPPLTAASTSVLRLPRPGHPRGRSYPPLQHGVPHYGWPLRWPISALLRWWGTAVRANPPFSLLPPLTVAVAATAAAVVAAATTPPRRATRRFPCSLAHGAMCVVNGAVTSIPRGTGGRATSVRLLRSRTLPRTLRCSTTPRTRPSACRAVLPLPLSPPLPPLQLLQQRDRRPARAPTAVRPTRTASTPCSACALQPSSFAAWSPKLRSTRPCGSRTTRRSQCATACGPRRLRATRSHLQHCTLCPGRPRRCECGFGYACHRNAPVAPVACSAVHRG